MARVTRATVRQHLFEQIDVLFDEAAQLALYFILLFDIFPHLPEFVLRQVFCAFIRIDLCLC
jgi:hypothetical protein